MRIVALSQAYLPDPTGAFLADLAGHWVGQGHEVTVLTANQPVARMDGVRTQRVVPVAYDRTSVARRTISHAAFAAGVGAALWSFRHDKQIDVVLFVGANWTGNFIPNRLAQRRIHWVHDVYPDALLALTTSRSAHLAAAVARFALDREWKRADAVVALSSGMRCRLARRLPDQRVLTIPLWALPEWVRRLDHAPTLRAARAIDEDAFVVTHHGNLGLAYNLEPMLRAALILRHDRSVVFAVVGSGAQRTAVERRVAREALSNVRIFEPVPSESFLDSLAMGDIHFLGLRPEWNGVSFPSKLVAALAVGRPCIISCGAPSDVAAVSASAGCAIACSEDPQAVANAIQQLRNDSRSRLDMSRRARELCDEVFSRTNAFKRWDNLLAGAPRED
jgi:putative colanic acid biosynthesis glycosyltransferase WcaI